MARPTKNNAQYFSHDADMRNDVKVKALRRRFQHKGYAVWCFILETLTDGENFEVEYDNVSRELLAADFEISVDQLEEIVDYCCKINLLQLSDEGKLYSEAHKRRFDELMLEREKKSRAGKLGMIKRWGKQSEIANDSDNTVITADNTPITEDSKIKYSKVKENIEKNIVYPYQDIIDLWNSICNNLPAVKVLNEKRRQKIKVRLHEMAESPDDFIPAVEKIFTRVRQSKFLCGDNPSNWTASFDWIFENSSNWIKISEGNYDNDRGKRTANKPGTPETLGAGEFIDSNGRRTYGTGKATIPVTAPPRPGDRYSWDELSKSWVML